MRRTLLPRLVCTSLQSRLHVHCEILHLFPTSSSTLWRESPSSSRLDNRPPSMSQTECCSIPYTLSRSSDADHWRVFYICKDSYQSATQLYVFLYIPNPDSDSILKLSFWIWSAKPRKVSGICSCLPGWTVSVCVPLLKHLCLFASPLECVCRPLCTLNACLSFGLLIINLQ